MKQFEYKYRVELVDIGRFNKLTNKAIIKILENAASMHSEMAEFGINDIERTRLGWIVLGWKIKIIKRVVYNEELTIKTWISKYNRMLLYRDFEVRDYEGNLIAIATSKWAMINVDEGKLSTILKEVIENHGFFDKRVFVQEDFFKINEPISYENSIDLYVQRRDIDINNHVHNLNYLDYAYEAIPEKIYNTEEKNNVEIIYKKQIKAGDKFKCLYKNEGGCDTISIKSNDHKILHAIIKLYN